VRGSFSVTPFAIVPWGIAHSKLSGFTVFGHAIVGGQFVQKTATNGRCVDETYPFLGNDGALDCLYQPTLVAAQLHFGFSSSRACIEPRRSKNIWAV
jgi:hypothetical protein